MKKSGNGWKTVSYYSGFGDENVTECKGGLFNYTTLGKIKNDFEGSCYFSCVGKSTCSKSIFQYVVECSNDVELEKLALDCANNIGLCQKLNIEFFTSYSWLDKVPKLIISNWIGGGMC